MILFFILSQTSCEVSFKNLYPVSFEPLMGKAKQEYIQRVLGPSIAGIRFFLIQWKGSVYR